MKKTMPLTQQNSPFQFDFGPDEITKEVSKLSNSEQDHLRSQLATIGPHLTLFGHRGCRYYPDQTRATLVENTLDTIQYGINVDLDGIEFDVWKTADNKLILAHGNELIQQLSLQPDDSRRSIEEFTQSELVEATQTAGIALTSFEEVVHLFQNTNQTRPNPIIMNVELKGPDTSTLTLATIQSICGTLPQWVLLSSFDGPNLTTLLNYDNLGSAQVSVLLEDVQIAAKDRPDSPTQLLELEEGLEMVTRFRDKGVSCYGISIWDRLLTDDVIQTLKMHHIRHVGIYSMLGYENSTADTIQNPITLLNTAEKLLKVEIPPIAFIDNPYAVQHLQQALKAR